MADGSAIEWTEATWNPTTGCDRLSAGLRSLLRAHLGEAAQGNGCTGVPNDGDPRTSGPGFGVTIHPDALRIPYGWREPRVVFVNSMSDLSDGVTILQCSFFLVRWHVSRCWRVRQVSRTQDAAWGLAQFCWITPRSRAGGKAVEQQSCRRCDDMQPEASLLGVRPSRVRALCVSHRPRPERLSAVATGQVLCCLR